MKKKIGEREKAISIRSMSQVVWIRRDEWGWEAEGGGGRKEEDSTSARSPGWRSEALSLHPCSLIPSPVLLQFCILLKCRSGSMGLKWGLQLCFSNSFPTWCRKARKHTWSHEFTQPLFLRESLEINTHTYSQLTFNKRGKNIQWEKHRLFSK